MMFCSVIHTARARQTLFSHLSRRVTVYTRRVDGERETVQKNGKGGALKATLVNKVVKYYTPERIEKGLIELRINSKLGVPVIIYDTIFQASFWSVNTFYLMSSSPVPQLLPLSTLFWC